MESRRQGSLDQLEDEGSVDRVGGRGHEDEVDEPYNPLRRPEPAANRPKAAPEGSGSCPPDRPGQVSSGSESGELSSSDSDSDAGGGFEKKRRTTLMSNSRGGRIPDAPGESQDAFRSMAADFQKNRLGKPLPPLRQEAPTSSGSGRGSNNVWGSLLQEDALTSELLQIEVGRKSLKELASDRGAETYDFTLASSTAGAAADPGSAAFRNKGDESAATALEKQRLEAELDSYWSSNGEAVMMETGGDSSAGGQQGTNSGGGGCRSASSTSCSSSRSSSSLKDSRTAICAGKKRSVRDRLGVLPPRQHAEFKESSNRAGGGDLDDDEASQMSIPPPGVPRTIRDLPASLLASSLEESGPEVEAASILGEEMAKILCEPKTELMVGVVDLVGPEAAVRLFRMTQQIEASGGMMIKNGARRRTPGGVYLQLLREKGPEELGVDPNRIRTFFAQSNSETQNERSRKNHKKRQGRRAVSKMSLDNDSKNQRSLKVHQVKDDVDEAEEGEYVEEDEDDEPTFQKELERFRMLANKVRSPAPKWDTEMGEDEDRQQQPDRGDDGGRQRQPVPVEDLKPLPDLLTACISSEAEDGQSQDHCATTGSATTASRGEPEKRGRKGMALWTSQLKNRESKDTFEEPGAPPNSVERLEATSSSGRRGDIQGQNPVEEDDDFLFSNNDTESIELF